MPTFPDRTPLEQVRRHLNDTGLRKNDFAAGRMPTPQDSRDYGWEVGSRWWFEGVEYICQNDNPNSAVWAPASDASAIVIAEAADTKATDALSAWTAWDAIAEVDPHRFGAMGFTFDQMVAANGTGMAEASAANDAAFDAAKAALLGRGGGIIRYRGLIYPISSTKRRGSNIRVEGAGPGQYLPTGGSVGRNFEGTVFLAYGTGPKEHSFGWMTSGERNGGWRPDPDNPGEHFRLFSGYNSDASGSVPATLRQFSVLLLDDLTDGRGGFSKIKALPWRGTDGVSDYLSASSPVWGSDWDFGYVVRNTEDVTSHDLSVVGPWREAGHALMIAERTGANYNRAERNTFVNCRFEGRIGHLVRSHDVWKTTATTENSLSIAWTSEHYWPASGQFRGNNSVTYTYTGTSRDGANLVFTGVTPDPTGRAHIRHASSGLANTIYRDCMVFDLYPRDGSTPQSHGIASTGLEVSGFPLRQLQFDNYKVHARGRVQAHWHQTADQMHRGVQFEGGGFVIASPEAAAQDWGPEATYETRGLRMDQSCGFSDGVDLRLFTPRNALVDELQLSPRGDYSGNLILRALRAGKSLLMNTVSGGRWGVTTPTGAEVLGVGDDGLIRLRRPDGTLVAQMGASGHTSFFNAAGVEVLRIPTSGAVSLRNGSQLTFTDGIARINWPVGEIITLREGTTTRMQIGPTGTRLSFQGPYADDAAAAAAGVEIGQCYRLASGAIAWRQV